MNTLSLSNGLLAIPYSKPDVEEIFIAVYNLNKLDYSKSLNTPFFMLGGIYVAAPEAPGPFILNILENNSTSTFTEAMILTSFIYYNG